jgi:ubiquinone/menaquinone biosynthesis C-methylase UbiE
MRHGKQPVVNGTHGPPQPTAVDAARESIRRACLASMQDNPATDCDVLADVEPRQVKDSDLEPRAATEGASEPPDVRHERQAAAQAFRIGQQAALARTVHELEAMGDAGGTQASQADLLRALARARTPTPQPPSSPLPTATTGRDGVKRVVMVLQDDTDAPEGRSVPVDSDSSKGVPSDSGGSEEGGSAAAVGGLKGGSAVSVGSSEEVVDGSAEAVGSSAVLSRSDLIRLPLYGAWAYGFATSVGRLQDFPPASFRALAKDVYLEAQEGVRAGSELGARRLRVLEIGSGTSLKSVFDGRFARGSEVLGVDVDEPSKATLKEAQARAAEAGFEFRFMRGDATDLRQLPAGSVDVVVCSLTLCSVPSCAAAVAEVRRVLRQGGRFGFVEHVKVVDGDERPFLALSQSVLDPVQQVVAHGCHLTRDSPQVILDAFGAESVVRMERALEDAMWPVSQIAAGIVAKGATAVS